MPRDSGTNVYTRPRIWVTDAANGVTFDPVKWDQQDADFEAALNDLPVKSTVLTFVMDPATDPTMLNLGSITVSGSTWRIVGLVSGVKQWVNITTGTPPDLSAYPTTSTVNTALALKANLALVGASNGIAALDSGGKVPVSQLPASVQGAMSYQGAWNASTNSPALASGTGTKGFYYSVSVAGTTAIDGIAQWDQGDKIAFNGTAWERFEGSVSLTQMLAALGYTPVSNARAIATAGLASGGGDLSADRTITVPKGAGSDLRTGTDDAKALTSKAVFDAAAEITLTFGATITLDFATGFNFALTMTGGATMGSPNNQKAGQSGYIAITQDASGSRAMTFSSAWKFSGGAPPTLTTTPLATDYLFYQVRASGVIIASLARDVK